MDNSSVFHRDMLDEKHQANFPKPWIFDSDLITLSFDTEDEACAMQRKYRIEHGFNPMTGELDGTSGQDRESYSDTQDRDSYTVAEDDRT